VTPKTRLARGLVVALVCLFLIVGAWFAVVTLAGPPIGRSVTTQLDLTTIKQPQIAEPSESPEPSDTVDLAETAEPDETAEPNQAAEAAEPTRHGTSMGTTAASATKETDEVGEGDEATEDSAEHGGASTTLERMQSEKPDEDGGHDGSDIGGSGGSGDDSPSGL